MPSNLSREELYALVWSKPMTAAAKELQVSDVALAKKCRKANVPVPPRGWWAKKHAGKDVATIPLPPLTVSVKPKLTHEKANRVQQETGEHKFSGSTPQNEHRRASFNHKFTFEIELLFSAESKPTSDLLIEGIQDLLFEADSNHRLVPGMPVPIRGERLVGTSISLTGMGREECEIDDESRAPLPLWEEGEDLRSNLFWHSIAIDKEIENLRADQSNIWKSYEILCPSIKPQNYRTQMKKIELNLSKFRTRCSNVAAQADTLIQKDKAKR